MPCWHGLTRSQLAFIGKTMEIIIKETGEKGSLSIVENNCDIIPDLIGSYGGFNDGQFVFDSEKNLYVCDKETFI